MSTTSTQELERWHSIAESALAQLRGDGVYSAEMIDSLRSHLASYREGLPASHER